MLRNHIISPARPLSRARRHLLFALALGLGLLAAPLSSRADSAAASADFQPFFFFFLGDPQMNGSGGPDYLQQHIDRFVAVANKANETRPPFVIIAGDLINGYPHGIPLRRLESGAFARALKALQVPARIIPGNHDIIDPATLGEYRRAYGQDYYSFVHNNCEFVCLNTVTLRDPAAYPVESRKQMEWLQRTLAAAREAGRARVFVVMHHPPLDLPPDLTLPLPIRSQVARWFQEYGVDAILAGHLHESREFELWNRIPVYTVAGTGMVYSHDKRRFGYRVFMVTRRGFRQCYVQLDRPADPPPPPRRPVLASAPGGPLTFSWSEASTHTAAFRYRVWRNGQPLAETLDDSFTDPAPPAGAVYQVSSLSLAGQESEKSAPLAAQAVRPVALVARDADWHCWDGAALPVYEWKMPFFNPSAWKRATPPLGAMASPASPLIYFRHDFKLAGASSLRGALLRLKAGAGAVAYLNGREVGRVGLLRGLATSVTLSHAAPRSAPAAAWTEFPLDPALLAPDTKNTLAVQLHRAAPAGGPLTLEAELVALEDSGELKLTRGPYLQAVGSEQVVLRWRTNLPCDSRVTLGSRPDALMQPLDDDVKTTDHAVQLAGLAPGTRYYYAIGSSERRLAGGGPEFHFTTAPPRGAEKNTRIWVLGDSGAADANARAVRDAYLGGFRAAPANLMIMLGDNAYDTGTDAQHQAAVFDTYPSILGHTPLYTCPGNHEYYSKNPLTGRPPYFDIFCPPAAGECGGVPSGSPSYYSFDYGNIHFVSLDSEGLDRSPNGPMLTWLKKDLAAAKGQRWLIAFFHHPPYSKGGHDSDSTADAGDRMIQMRQHALPILEAGGVDLVLCGHSHSYERSFLLDGHYGHSSTLAPSMMVRSSGLLRTDGPYLKPTLGLAPHEGTVYATVGSSGKLTPGPLNHPAMCRSIFALGSLVIDVEGRWLNARFIGREGRILDSFSILKGSSANQMPKK